jgi:endonuclease III
MSELLVQIAKQRFDHPESEIVHFVEDEEANVLLNDLKHTPHAYVLGCLMDRQIKTERAWKIPLEVFKGFGVHEVQSLSEIPLSDLSSFFSKMKLHRFNKTMAEVFHSGVQDILLKYEGDASNIWNGNPSSSTVVYRFLEFKGSGIKISTMAANILARQFRVPFSDYYSIDISPDVHIIRVMKRMGVVPSNATIDMIIYKARELYPEFPGIIDFSCWEIGRNWCKPSKPKCEKCIVEKDCRKIIG